MNSLSRNPPLRPEGRGYTYSLGQKGAIGSPLKGTRNLRVANVGTSDLPRSLLFELPHLFSELPRITSEPPRNLLEVHLEVPEPPRITSVLPTSMDTSSSGLQNRNRNLRESPRYFRESFWSHLLHNSVLPRICRTLREFFWYLA